MDSDSPGCLYDTTDCTGCSCDPSPLDLYLEYLREKEEENKKGDM